MDVGITHPCRYVYRVPPALDECYTVADSRTIQID